MVSLHKNEEEQKKQKIRMEVRTAFLRHKEALQEVEALKLSVRQAQENYRIMQNRYLNQLAILTDLLDANSVLNYRRLAAVSKKKQRLWQTN